MPELITRHRPLTLLATVVIAQVLLLAFQVKRQHDVLLIRYWTAAATTPFERAASWSLRKASGAWTGYVDLRHARQEDRGLRDRLGQLELRNRALESKAAEAGRLEQLLGFRDAHPEAPMVAAQVIGGSADPASQTLFINRGERDRVRVDDPVITPEGIAGKIVEVLPHTAQLQLINDRESGVGALLADTRTHGVVEGTGDPRPRLWYIVNDEPVRPGEEILTSGEDRIFPKGLLIGTVAAVKQGSPFQMIRVEPATRLDRLEDVIVLLTRQELAPRRETSGAPADLATGVPAAPPSGAPATAPAQHSSLNAPASARSEARGSVAKNATAKNPIAGNATAPAQNPSSAARAASSEKPAASQTSLQTPASPVASTSSSAASTGSSAGASAPKPSAPPAAKPSSAPAPPPPASQVSH